MLNKRQTGADAESLAIIYLRSIGYSIWHCNYHARGGELDIVARKDKELLIVEVKQRRSQAMFFESITEAKIKHLKFAVRKFLSKHPIIYTENWHIQIDSIGLISEDSLSYEIVHIPHIA